MKTIALLRHAKSSWDDPGLDDFDRPLNARGQAAAQRMGREIRALALEFDLALVSPARRAAETFELVGRELDVEWRFEPRLYLASPAEMLGMVSEVADAVTRLLLVGHNPGTHELALRLIEGDPSPAARLLDAKFPTGALAEIALPVERWEDAGDSRGSLTRFVRPRDLD